MNYRAVSSLGAGMVLVVVGAILRYGITATISGVDLDVIGQIFVVTGTFVALIGLVSYLTEPMGRRTETRIDRRRTPSGDVVERRETHIL